jgi:predicted nucleotidyltransferase
MLKQRIPLKEELEFVVGRKVDLLVKHEINQHIRDAILMEAKDL